ncbi:MAG: histidine triad nucleotide-binding protein [bacterium]
MAETIFSKIIRKEIPADIVYEDDDILAFKDINPQAPFHILIIPKKEIATVNNLSDSDEHLIAKLILRAKILAKELGFSGDGYRLVLNCNSNGGQEVYHLHLHLLGGRQMHWPPG